MTISWVMRTLDRTPRKNYLGETIRRLADSAGGALPPMTVCDSGVVTGTPWWEREIGETSRHLEAIAFCHAGRRLTNNENALDAMREGVQAGTDWVVHLEDDLDVCDDFFGSVERWLIDHTTPDGVAEDDPREDVALNRYLLYTFHCPYKGVHRALTAGRTYYEYPVKDFYGNQCWAMLREHAQSLVTFLEDRIPQWHSGQGFDMLIKAWATEAGQEYFLASAPSFVQHVGSESSLHFGRFHQNASWPGRGWRYIGNGGSR